MSDDLRRYYQVDDFETTRVALRPLGLADSERLISRSHTTVDWLGQTFDPPPTYDETGNELTPGTDQGVLMNVYGTAERADIIAALDELFERRYPVTPIRDIAGADTVTGGDA